MAFRSTVRQVLFYSVRLFLQLDYMKTNKGKSNRVEITADKGNFAQYMGKMKMSQSLRETLTLERNNHLAAEKLNHGMIVFGWAGVEISTVCISDAALPRPPDEIIRPRGPTSSLILT